MDDSVKFTTTGELDNGWTATAYWELDGNTMDDQKLTLDMGDGGTFGFANNTAHGYGIDKVKNFVPGADTPAQSVWTTDLIYAGGAGTTGNLAYQLAVGDTGLTVGAEQEVDAAGGYSRSVSLHYDNPDLGFSVGVGTSDLAPDNGNGGNDETAVGAKFAAGNFTIGGNHNEVDYGGTTNDIDNQHYGVSYAVNDDLTVSYAVVTNSRDTAAEDEELTMIAASYTMGSIKFAGFIGKQASVSGVAGDDDAMKHLTMTLTF